MVKAPRNSVPLRRYMVPDGKRARNDQASLHPARNRTVPLIELALDSDLRPEMSVSDAEVDAVLRLLGEDIEVIFRPPSH